MDNRIFLSVCIAFSSKSQLNSALFVTTRYPDCRQITSIYIPKLIFSKNLCSCPTTDLMIITIKQIQKFTRYCRHCKFGFGQYGITDVCSANKIRVGWSKNIYFEYFVLCCKRRSKYFTTLLNVYVDLLVYTRIAGTS